MVTSLLQRLSIVALLAFNSSWACPACAASDAEYSFAWYALTICFVSFPFILFALILLWYKKVSQNNADGDEE